MSANLKTGLICLVLVMAMVAATIAGAYFIFKPDVNEDPVVDTGSSESSGGDNNSAENNSSSARYIDPRGYGYQTVANETYFFKVIDITKEPYYDLFAGDLSMHLGFVNGHNYPLYSDYVTNIKYSLDGVLWCDFSSKDICENPNHKPELIGYFQDFSDDTKTVYISFTSVNNCANPYYVMNDLIDGAFPLLTYYFTFRTTEPLPEVLPG